MTLQHLMEALIELCLDQVYEGSGEGGMEVGFLPESCPDPGSLLKEAKHLICAWVHRRVAQENVTDNSPGIQLLGGGFPSCDRCNLLPLHEEACVCERRDRSSP